MVSEVTRGHPTPNQGLFGVIWGKNPNIFKPRQIIYQNEALGALITGEGFYKDALGVAYKDAMGLVYKTLHSMLIPCGRLAIIWL